MAATHSEMLALGTRLPAFSLVDAVSGRAIGSADVEGSPLLVMFICNHCPFVIHVRPELTAIDRDFSPRGLKMLAINSNDVDNYPDDAPVHMKSLAAELGWSFPFLHDEDQQVAKVFHAACTPDFYLFDANAELAYRGQLDASRPQGEIPLDGADLRAAIEAVLAGEKPKEKQVPSLGCNIKWKPGNAPEYFG